MSKKTLYGCHDAVYSSELKRRFIKPKKKGFFFVFSYLFTKYLFQINFFYLPWVFFSSAFFYFAVFLKGFFDGSRKKGVMNTFVKKKYNYKLHLL
ncbi:hypothetical protein EDC94DRAFT_591667 [Helicostylum pulchrum]|nr:hypothetical protein EDC94DRAFT_591667 [Helicostylum pulchrum]